MTTIALRARPAAGVGWVLLFPCTYMVHIAEELWAGEGFHHWLSRVSGAAMTEQRFLVLNLCFLLAMLAASLVAARRGDLWIVLALASVVLINSALHVAGSLWTGSYSPGLVSALLLWAPLGVAAARRARRELTSAWQLGALVAGVAAHLVVSALALGLL